MLRARVKRSGPALGVVLVHLLLGYVLLIGLVGREPRRAPDRLTLVALLPEPPRRDPPRPPPEPASARSARAPVPLAAPAAPPTLVILAAPASASAPIALTGLPAPASPMPAAGEGGGAGGSGLGGGGSGEGDGGGDADGWTSARQIAGKFRRSDFPRSARDAEVLRVGVEFAIGPDGRVAACRVLRPSGDRQVDAMTCDVIRRRYRFEPARDDKGEPVTEVWEEDEVWTRGEWDR